MHFKITGLPVESFAPLFGADDAALQRAGARRVRADVAPGFPCRITLEDAAPGETLLLLNYVHQPADTPFRASHAIFVRESATHAAVLFDRVPAALRARVLAVRSFDARGMMVDADLTDGTQLESLVERLLANPAAAYLHVHYAKPGCYAARVDRIGAPPAGAD